MNKKVLYSVIGVIVLLFVLVLMFGQSNQPVVTTQSAPQTVTAATPEKQSPISILTASTDHYAQLLEQGKSVLGTTQYDSAARGTSALHDPNSPASKFSAFRNSNCVANDPGANAMDAYRQASDIASGTTIDSWSENVNNAASDFCLWTQDAVDWEIGKVSVAQLHADEQTVITDLTKARANIKSLSK